MNFELEQLIKKIKGGFICVTADREFVVHTPEELKEQLGEGVFKVQSISARENSIVLEITKEEHGKMPVLNKDAAWVREYVEENGTEPGFF